MSEMKWAESIVPQRKKFSVASLKKEIKDSLTRQGMSKATRRASQLW